MCDIADTRQVTFREVKVSRTFRSPTLKGQILSFWSSSPDPPQNHLFSSSLWSSSLSSLLWFSSSSSHPLRPNHGERSCLRVFHDRSSPLTDPLLRRMNSSCGKTQGCDGRARSGCTARIHTHKWTTCITFIISFSMHVHATVLLRHLFSKLVSFPLGSLFPQCRGVARGKSRHLHQFYWQSNPLAYVEFLPTCKGQCKRKPK